MMTGSRSSALAWWAAATILVSAFLLFQVQPVISKKILPWFGGSPAVWTTCMLFFQMVLLAGYAYAHVLIRYVPARRQGIIHTAILVLALFTLLPSGITPSEFWKPNDGTLPAWRILLLLGAKVGAPYFLLSSTGPLVQAWFSQLYPGRSPYRLYALSNLGSLGALLTYPFVFEIWLPVNMQGLLWSLAFLVFAILIGYLAITMWREAKRTGAAPEGEAATRAGSPEATAVSVEPPTWWLRIAWLALAMLPSVAFLAITHHLVQDIAVIPPMLLMPLSLYLLSLIICFDGEWWYQRRLWGPLTIAMIVWLTATQNYSDIDRVAVWVQKPITPTQADPPGKAGVLPITFSGVNDRVVFRPVGKIGDGLEIAANWALRVTGLAKRGWRANWNANTTTEGFNENVIVVSCAYLLTLFLICMVSHGELVKSKPHPKHLTGFYLSISTGGALGGLFVALVCPFAFKLHFELPLSMICGFVVAAVALANDGRQTWLKGREVLQWSAAFLIVGGVLLVSKGNVDGIAEGTLAIERNFYGTIYVTALNDEEEPENNGKALYNGRIWHGFQYLDPQRRLEPTTYYINSTGAALAVNYHPRAGQGLRVAVIGLGTGSMAAHGKPGDVYRFYDIDPKVVKIAKEQFSYLADSLATVEEPILGDARIQMERELKAGPQNYDVIVLDAFSGDAIPAHLLTSEAFAIYDQHLRRDENGEPTGIVAVHISNRYLDLEPVVAAIAKQYGYQTLMVHTDEGPGHADTASDWVLVTKNQRFLWTPAVMQLGQPLTPNKPLLLWTDQRTSLLPILDTE